VIAVHVRAKPRDGSELGAVGDLVHADPQAEVARVDVEFAFGGHDVRSNQSEPAVAGRLVIGRGRQEELVLPQHLAREVGEHDTELGAGDPSADSARKRATDRSTALLGEPLEQRLHHDPEATDVAAHPPGAVDHAGHFVFATRGHSGELCDVILGLDRESAQ
jgi:hypothetical protein